MSDAPLGFTSAMTGRFFLLAIGGAWLLQLPAALAKLGVIAGPPDKFGALLALGAFSPLIAAIICKRREPGGRGLFASARVPWFWYLVSLGAFGAIALAGTAAFALATQQAPAQWWWPPTTPEQIAATLLIPLVEEPGWRGFALPRLQARWGPLRASALLGGGWAAWHLMMFIVQGFTPLLLAVALCNIFAGAFIFTWLANRTAGSVLIAIIAHAGTHLDNPALALPATPTPFLVFTAAVWVAAGLTLLDRKAWVVAGR